MSLPAVLLTSKAPRQNNKISLQPSSPSLPAVRLTSKAPRQNNKISLQPSSPKNKTTLMTTLPHATAEAEYFRQPITDDIFHPRIWDVRDLISSSTISVAWVERHKALLEEVKNLLFLAADDPFQGLDLVDKLQQLGVGYRFEAEIEDILRRSYDEENFSEDGRADLHYNSLRFRLLRQAGFYASPDIFNKYKDENGEFRSNLTSDVQGMLSLYEATYLSIGGEDIMDEAQAFTTKHLNSIVTTLRPPLALQVQRALNIPLHHGVERVHARHYISVYQEDKSCNNILLEFAKLDFNIVQLIHKKELAEVSEWWERLTADIKPKLPYQFRDRIVESYLLMMSINFEPHFSLGRIHLTKTWGVFTIFDDAHDVYGNLEELGPLHDALQRWDVEDLRELADHMKVIFHEVKNLYKEIEVDMIRRRHFIGIPYYKKEVKRYLALQFEEATLMFLKDLPTLEMWMQFSSATTGHDAFLVDAVMTLGEIATKEVFEWIDSKPEVINNYKLITRLLDDIATFKLEKARGQTVSNMFCYMQKYGVSEEEATRGLQKEVIRLWKDMNKSVLRPNPVPRLVLKCIIGTVRVAHEYYTERDGDMYTESKGRMSQLVASLLRDNIPI